MQFSNRTLLNSNRPMIIYLLAIGLISILGQVVLLRELNVAFYGIELIYLLALGVWLFWTAVGAVIGRHNHLPSYNSMASLFIIFAFVMPLDIAFIRSSRLIFGGIPGAYLTFYQQLIVVVISILPAGLLSGLLFQRTARAYVTTGKTLAAAYAVESLGGLLGGLFSTLLMMWGVGNFATALLCAFVSSLTPFIVPKEFKSSFLRLTAVVLSCIFLVLLWKAPPLDYQMTAWNHPNLLASSDSPYGRVAVTQLYNQISVFENDALSFETEGTEAETFSHLAALQHPHPQSILILGGGIEGIVREMEKYAPQRIDYVELNPVMLNLAIKNHLPDDIKKSLQERNVHMIFADPRQYLEKSDMYDLILVGMPEPASGQANRFYTREFFQQCAAKLKPVGILAFRLRTAENMWTIPLTRRNASIYNALKSVFPEVLFLPGTTNVVTASFSPLPRTPETLSRRLQEGKITTRLISPNYINYLFTNDRFFTINDLLRKEKSPPNSDTRPVCYQYAFVIWLSKFFPRLALIDPTAIMNRGFFQPPLVWFWIGLPVIFLLCRFKPALRRTMLVAAAGFVGMVLETILILYYQVKQGVLYQDIGLLLMSFMAGLALGAMVVNRVMARQVVEQRFSRWYGIILLAGFCSLCAFTAIILTRSMFARLIEISLLLAITGFLVAGIFAYVSLHNIEDQKRVISPLYAADLIGGCLGSLLGSLILIPLAGMDVTTWGMLLIAAFSVVLL
jgi:spermidine synthase